MLHEKVEIMNYLYIPLVFDYIKLFNLRLMATIFVLPDKDLNEFIKNKPVFEVKSCAIPLIFSTNEDKNGCEQLIRTILPYDINLKIYSFSQMKLEVTVESYGSGKRFLFGNDSLCIWGVITVDSLNKIT